MSDQHSGGRKIEFKKSPNIRLKKYHPEKKFTVDKVKRAKYAATYEFNDNDGSECLQEELFI